MKEVQSSSLVNFSKSNPANGFAGPQACLQPAFLQFSYSWLFGCVGANSALLEAPCPRGFNRHDALTHSNAHGSLDMFCDFPS